MNCKPCIKRQSKFKANETVEITTEEIKESRKEYADDIQQRFRGEVANRRYIELYGKKGFTQEEIKNAKYVYPGYYKDE